MPYAIQCARQQEYPSKEILIVSSGDDVGDLVSGERHAHLGGKPTIGRMRNVGVQHALGTIVCHFDDDDFSRPDRLQSQVEQLRQSGKAVAGFRSMRFTDGREWWLYAGSPDYALGTSLCYLREWAIRHPFPDKMVGEDKAFVVQAHERGAIVSVDAGDLMWATIHPGNTSPRQLTGKFWRKIDSPRNVPVRNLHEMPQQSGCAAVSGQ